MWKAEEDFPRGGGQKSDGEVSTPQESHQPDVKKAAKKRKSKDIDVDKSAADLFKKAKKSEKGQVIDTPLSQCLAANLCVLGCVREAFEYSVKVSLPGNQVATLPITEVSAAYTQQLRKLAEAKDTEIPEEIRPLDEMLRPGLLIPVMISSVQQKSKGKSKVKVSCSPSKINSGCPIANISDGMLMYGSVVSVEDTGYRVDLGVKGLQAFLTNKEAAKMIKSNFKGTSLTVGQTVWCVVSVKGKAGLKAGESRTVNVSVDPDTVKKAVISNASNMSSILPGMRVSAKVEKKLESGLCVKIDEFEAVIHGSQLPKSALSYKPKAEIEARVLYVNPVTKVVQLTALPKLVNFDGGTIDFFTDLRRGTILEAKVSRVERRKGLYFTLDNNVTAFATTSNLTDKAGTPDLTDYTLEQTHQCRVLGFNYMEGVALVTLKQSVIDQKFLTIEDITVGEIVKGTIKEVFFNGVSVSLSKGINAFVPAWHLADVPIKHPEKKFEADQTLKCRVVRIDKSKSRVMLTHKKSLVNSKHPIVSEFPDLRPHMEVDGVIITIKERVVIVGLFGEVKGFVTLNDMSTEKVEDPSEMFYVGQVIRCRVVHFNVEEKRLKLSFNFGTQKETKKTDSKKTDAQPTVFEIGKTHPASVIKRTDEGFHISVLPDKSPALLPFSHLSDYTEIQELWKLCLTPRQQLPEVTYFNQKKQTIMTMKESFLDSAKEQHLPDDFSELKCGQLVPAAIKNHEDYGIFLELAAGHIGLCPAKTLTNLQPTSLSDLFHPGQTVVTRLSKIDSEKKRFLGSLRVDECYEGGLEVPLRLLRNYLKSREEVLNRLFAEQEDFSSYSSLKVNEIVKVKVTSVYKKGILGELESGAKALATKHHIGGITPEEGKSYDAVVLFVDPLIPCVELSLEPKLVKCVRKRKENAFTKLKPEQVVKADLVLVKPEFLLMSLRGHGAGKFVMVPARKHMNDVEVNPMHQIGTYTDVVIKEFYCGVQMATLLMHDPVAKAKEEEEIGKKKQAKHKTPPGAVLQARVRTVHPLQLNILVGALHGRVHVSETVDDPKLGEKPVRRFHPEQVLDVRVIGLRDVKSQRYLPITKPKENNKLLECTLKPSKMSCEVDKLLVESLTLSPGDKLWVYVIKVSVDKVWVQVGLTQQGYIHFFHLSHDMAVINAADAHFPPGLALQATVLKSQVSDKNKMELSLVDNNWTELSTGDTVTAQISSIKPDLCLHVRLPGGRRGKVEVTSSILYAVGQYIQCQVTGVEDDVFDLSLTQDSQVEVAKKKRKRKTSVGEQQVEVEDLSPEKLLKKQKRLKKKLKQKRKEKMKQAKGSEGEEEEESSSEEEAEASTTAQTCVPGDTEQVRQRLSLPNFSWDGQLESAESGGGASGTELHDSDDDDNVAPESIKSKKKRKREEEKQIQEYERSQRSGEASTPQAAADFERLVLQSPHSSLAWLGFIAHHLELAELEKARAVAERALSTISFREEQEKQNVWLAYLNMEMTYGDENDVKKVLERAVQYCEPLPIYVRLSDMYVSAGKPEEAEQLYITMTRKFKKDKSVWKSYAQFLFKSNRTDSARNLLQRCITVLEKKDHVEVITRFATLEFNHGDAERGRTMFENLIASYPGRTDLWSVYVDMVVKVGDIQGARQLLERCVKLKLNSKKLSFLLQKFVKFEETHGTDEEVQRVRDMAVEVMEP